MGLTELKKLGSKVFDNFQENAKIVRSEINKAIVNTPGAAKAAMGAFSCLYQPTLISIGPGSMCVKGVVGYFQDVREKVSGYLKNTSGNRAPTSKQDLGNSEQICE